MACFAVPVAEAIVVTAAAVILQKKEAAKLPKLSSGEQTPETEQKTGFAKKLKWLASLLWGGAFLLAFEHVWHGEVVPWFPFLTAMSNPADAAEMFHEMATVGVTMALLVTAVWVGMLVISHIIETRAAAPQTATREG